MFSYRSDHLSIYCSTDGSIEDPEAGIGFDFNWYLLTKNLTLTHGASLSPQPIGFRSSSDYYSLSTIT